MTENEFTHQLVTLVSDAVDTGVADCIDDEKIAAILIDAAAALREGLIHTDRYTPHT